MLLEQLLNGDSMLAKQGSNPSSNSAAIPLPNAFWAPEFRCRPFAQLVSKWLIYLMLPTWRERFWEAAARFLPGLREKRTGSATAGPPSRIVRVPRRWRGLAGRRAGGRRSQPSRAAARAAAVRR